MCKFIPDTRTAATVVPADVKRRVYSDRSVKTGLLLPFFPPLGLVPAEADHQRRLAGSTGRGRARGISLELLGLTTSTAPKQGSR